MSAFLLRHAPTGWCTIGNGTFLQHSVSHLLEELFERRKKEKSIESSIPVEDIEYNMEQCFECLYGFSNLSNRYLKHHNCRPVSNCRVKTKLQTIPLYLKYSA